MKKSFLFIVLLLTAITVFCQETTCDHCWDADSLGNHRVLIDFTGSGKITKVIIPWRRRDTMHQDKRIIMEDAKTHHKLLNVKATVNNREYGEVYFEPVSGAGTYYLYDMPYKNEGRSSYPQGIYLKPENTAAASWLALLGEDRNIPEASVTSFQSIDDFDRFDDMEIIATKKETGQLAAQHKDQPFLVFPEDRLHSIRMTGDLPKRWIDRGLRNSFADTARRGEYFAYQLGVYALQDLRNVKVHFSDLKNEHGGIIRAKNISCLNTDGTDFMGKAMHPVVNVQRGKIQALWCLVDVPGNLSPGKYSGKLWVMADQLSAGKSLSVDLIVKNETASDHGVADGSKMGRLKWLNSTMAQENTVIPPYTALRISGNTISLLGRKVTLDDDGLPKQIQTFFTPEMTGYQSQPNNLLSQGIHFHFIKRSTSRDIQWKKEGLKFTLRQPGTVEWSAVNTSDDLKMEVKASLEFDGYISYQVQITARRDIDLSNTAMHIPFVKQQAKYIMGLGLKGQKRPEDVKWKWDVATKNQDGAWIGNVNAGLRYTLRDEHYARPLVTYFYMSRPLKLPLSWGNGTQGGINIGEKENGILADNYSGPRNMKKGETLYYNFTLLVTPFHPLRTDFQWANRFYQSTEATLDPDTIKATGANIVNIHQGTPPNPFINYPYVEWRRLKEYINQAHGVGLKVKIYNTILGLSNHADEIYAFKGLNHEIYEGGYGGGFSWLQEHLGGDYMAAWYTYTVRDAAIVNTPSSRWYNYYVEGMNWLTQKIGIDGIYLDDVAYDRFTMKRVRRVLKRNGHPGIIDLHTANQFAKAFGWDSNANFYMDLFPYIDRLWLGEFFDYENNSPDYFLTEVSGIPYGLMGEMLQDGGNPWRGMIYGMTNRLPWSNHADPRPLWQVWKDFGMEGSQMVGYWSDRCPVTTDNGNVIATVYKRKGSALISIASWAQNDTTVHLKIDWKKLGLDPARTKISAPEIRDFQPAMQVKADGSIPVAKGKGWLFILKEK